MACLSRYGGTGSKLAASKLFMWGKQGLGPYSAAPLSLLREMSVCISVYEARSREHTEKTSKQHGVSGVASMKNEGLRSPCVDSRMLLMVWLLLDDLMKNLQG